MPTVTPSLPADAVWTAQAGSPFPHAVIRDDVIQGGVGDCGELAFLAWLAEPYPSVITHILQASGSNWIASLYGLGDTQNIVMDQEKSNIGAEGTAYWTNLLERASAYASGPNLLSGIAFKSPLAMASRLGLAEQTPKNSKIYGGNAALMAAGILEELAAGRGVFIATTNSPPTLQAGSVSGGVGLTVAPSLHFLYARPYALQPGGSVIRFGNPWGPIYDYYLLGTEIADIGRISSVTVIAAPTQTPDPSGTLTASATGNDTVNLLGGVHRITIEQAPNLNATSYAIVRDGVTLTTSRYIVDNVGDALPHDYSLIAFNSAGSLTVSASYQAFASGIGPPEPQITINPLANYNVFVSWTPADTATAYNVYRNGVQIATTTNLGIQNTLTTNEPNVYGVEAVNADGTSSRSLGTITLAGAPMSASYAIAAAPLLILDNSGEDFDGTQYPLSWMTIGGVLKLCTYDNINGNSLQSINLTTGAVTDELAVPSSQLLSVGAIADSPSGYIMFGQNGRGNYLIDKTTGAILGSGQANWPHPANTLAFTLGGILYDAGSALVVEASQGSSGHADVLRGYPLPALTNNGAAVTPTFSSATYGSGIFGNLAKLGSGYQVADASQADGTMISIAPDLTAVSGILPGMTGAVAYGVAVGADSKIYVFNIPNTGLNGNLYRFWRTDGAQTINGNFLGGTIGSGSVLTFPSGGTITSSQDVVKLDGATIICMGGPLARIKGAHAMSDIGTVYLTTGTGVILPASGYTDGAASYGSLSRSSLKSGLGLDL